MSRTKQIAETTAEFRTHFVGIHTPEGGIPRIGIFRERIDAEGKRNLGEKVSIGWADLAQHEHFTTFKTSAGITSSQAFFDALKTLFDDLCDD